MESGGEGLPDTIKEITRLYLDQIDVLGGRIEALASTLRVASEEHVETRRLCTFQAWGRSQPAPSWPSRPTCARSPAGGVAGR